MGGYPLTFPCGPPFVRPQNPEIEEMKEVWNRIEKWLSANSPQLLNSLNPGVSERDLDIFEESMRVQLPPEVRASFRVHNGQRDELLREAQVSVSREKDIGLFNPMWLLSLAGMKETWKRLAEWYPDSERMAPPNQQTRYSPYYIPFASTTVMVPLCLDLVPKSQKYGQILSIDMTSLERVYGFGTFSEYLMRFADELECSLYEPLPSGALQYEFHKQYASQREAIRKQPIVLTAIVNSFEQKRPYPEAQIASMCFRYQLSADHINEEIKRHRLQGLKPNQIKDIKTQIEEMAREQQEIERRRMERAAQAGKKICRGCGLGIGSELTTCPTCGESQTRTLQSLKASMTSQDMAKTDAPADERSPEPPKKFEVYLGNKWTVVNETQVDQMRKKGAERRCLRCKRMIFDDIDKCPDDGSRLLKL